MARKETRAPESGAQQPRRKRRSAPAAEPAPPASAPPAEHDDGVPPVAALPFPVVGVGGSAGGLEPAKELLAALPPETGMAFVMIQHLDPSHASMLPEILGRATRMPVAQVADGMAIEPDHVYVIPPGANLGLARGVLRLWPRWESRGQHRPVDTFLRSLAADQKHLAIGVILSGSATDGTLGLEEIKAEGGITFAQDETAQHDSMPRSAIAAGCVDFVLAPADIAGELARISRHPYVAPLEPVRVRGRAHEPALARILELLRQVTGVDFTHYKDSTLQRRIARRMVLRQLDSIGEYARLLQTRPAEVEALYQDILISVTSFFRNAEAFDVLKSAVFPELTRNRARHEPVRVWVLGCSTGEEAYSVAMAFSEFAEASGRAIPMQLFGTDLNASGIERARAGLYSRDAVRELSAERLHRFFVEADGSYRISKSMRETCIFARHNVLAEPPFSRIDLVCCRNLLIYLEPPAQRQLMASLHFAIRPGGFLWLGNSETIAGYRDLFDVQDARHKLYTRRPGGARLALSLPVGLAAPEISELGPRRPTPESSLDTDLRKETDRLLIARYAPPAVLVNGDFEILQFRGDTGRYLTPAPGKASLNLLKMLREGLLLSVRGALQRAKRGEVAVRDERIRVKTNGGRREVAIEVTPITIDSETCFLVSFEEGVRRGEVEPAASKRRAKAVDPREADRESVRLSQELTATREYLQSLIEQQEVANEELQSANEEVQSANEELQSINEELETSKEEIESSNEELSTVNEELQNRNVELAESNNDLLNLFVSAQLPMVMLGPDLRIRRFTPMAETLFNLIPADVGRPLTDIQMNLDVPDLAEKLRAVIETASVHEREVRDARGCWYSLRMRPYRTLENAIEGAVIVLLDIDGFKRDEERLRRQGQLLDQASEPILMWDFERGTITYWNRGAAEVFGHSQQEALGRNRQDLLQTSPQVDAFREVLGASRRWSGELVWQGTDGRETFADSRMSLITDDDGHRIVLETDVPITQRKRMVELRSRTAQLVAMDRNRNEFLAVLAHELRNPLASLRHAVELLTSPAADDAVREQARGVAERQTQAMTRLVEDLLDVARLTQDRIPLRLEEVELTALLGEAAEAARHEVNARGQELAVSLPEEPIHVLGDPARLKQIVGNLLGNAGKFTPPGGHIWLSAAVSRHETESAKREVIVRVRDDGMGIEPARLPTIFDRFLEIDTRVDAGKRGLGIGLPLVRRLVELHGGRVELYSDGENRGTQVVLILPVRLAAAVAADVEPALERDAAAQAPPQRVLVVDDNEDSARSLALLLRLEGHEVQTAHDAEAALAVAARHRPGVVLLDIALPGKDGYQLARELRQEETTRDATLVAVTGYAREQDRERALEAGFDLHLTKPVEPARLKELFADLAGHRT